MSSSAEPDNNPDNTKENVQKSPGTHGGRGKHKFSRHSTDVEVRWKALEKDLSFVNHLTIARDGGFSEVPQLWYSLRYVFAAVLLWTTAMNIHQLVDNSITVWKEGGKVEHVVDQYLFTQFIAESCLPDFISKHYDPEVILAIFEVGALLVLFGRIALNVFYICAGFTPMSRWSSVNNICWEVVPFLSSFSAMKMLNYVTPTILVPRINQFVQDCKDDLEEGVSSAFVLLQTLGFVSLRVLLFIFGFDAFAMKLGMVASSVQHQHPRGEVMLATGLFLNQVLGVLDIDMFTKTRLFRFIFGGEDAKIDAQERCTMRVWKAMLLRKMWEAFHEQPLKLLALLLTFDDLDFQRLMLNEKAALKKD